MKVIKVSDEAYSIVDKMSKETETPISEVASMLIINKDKNLRISERIVKNIVVIE